MDDGGGGYVAAQPGPKKEPVPLTWIRAAVWCLGLSSNIATVAMGILLLFLWPFEPDGAPVGIVGGSISIVLGSLCAADIVRALVTKCRESREMEAMTRLHVVPVSRR